MANELYRFTDPDSASVTLTFDSGQHIVGVPVVYDNRNDAKMLPVPLDATGGAVITIAAPGWTTQSHRAIFMPNPNGKAALDIDDFHLTPDHVTPPTPEPTPPPGPGPDVTDPLDRINAIYNTGLYNLVSKEGCGVFTEAVATDFALFYGVSMWGHVFKTPGQNQHNKHAVDAIHALWGEDHGIWDIITSSASTSAKPAFNRAGDQKPDLWRPYTPLPCQDALSTANQAHVAFLTRCQALFRSVRVGDEREVRRHRVA